MSYMYKIIYLAGLSFILFVSGCSESRPPEHSKKSAGQQVVEDMTGISNIRAGQKARAKIEAISAQKSNELQEITGP